jgi:hypothetical protein
MSTQEVTQKTNNNYSSLIELDKNKICPICHERYNTIEKRKINNNIYVYFIHKTKDQNGKVHIHKCYAGSKDNYIYVQKFQNNSLTLKGNISNYDKYAKFMQYLEDILNAIETEKEFKEFTGNVTRIIWKHEKRLYKKELQKPSQ